MWQMVRTRIYSWLLVRWLIYCSIIYMWQMVRNWVFLGGVDDGSFHVTNSAKDFYMWHLVREQTRILSTLNAASSDKWCEGKPYVTNGARINMVTYKSISDNKWQIVRANREQWLLSFMWHLVRRPMGLCVTNGAKKRGSPPLLGLHKRWSYPPICDKWCEN